MSTIILGLVELLPKSLDLPRGRRWFAPWDHRLLAVTDGERIWNCQDPLQMAACEAVLVAADLIVVDHVPYGLCHLSAAFYSLDVIERALVLGEPDRQYDLPSICAARHMPVSPWLWHPMTTPTHVPVWNGIVRQAQAIRDATVALHKVQQDDIRQRHAPAFERMLATVGPLDALYKRMTLDGICLDPGRRGQLLTQGEGLLSQIGSVLRSNGLEDPRNDACLNSWLIKHGLIPRPAPPSWTNDDLKNLARSSGSREVSLVARYRRFASVLSEPWLSGGFGNAVAPCAPTSPVAKPCWKSMSWSPRTWA